MALNIWCFIIPLLLMLPAFWQQNAKSLLFLSILFLTDFYASLKLMFAATSQHKHAAHSHLAGIVVAFVFFLPGAYLVNVGQSSLQVLAAEKARPTQNWPGFFASRAVTNSQLCAGAIL